MPDTGYRDDLRGKLRAKFTKKVVAKGVGYANSAAAAEQARRIHDRGTNLQKKATDLYKRRNLKWVLAEYRKLQLKSWAPRPELKPDWARSGHRMMQQAEKNVLNRYLKRMRKIEGATRREIARVRRNNAPVRSRTR
jgi:hypothetical protein